MDLEDKLRKPNFLLDGALSSALDEIQSLLGNKVKAALHDKEGRRVHFPKSLDAEQRPSYISQILEVASSLDNNSDDTNNVEKTSYLGILGTPLSLVIDRPFSELTEEQIRNVYDFVENKLSQGLKGIFEPQNEEIEKLTKRIEKLETEAIYETQFNKVGIPIHTRAYACDVLEGKLERFRGAKLRDGAQSEELSVLVLDIDNFKNVNDNLGGHANGDKVIYAVAKAINEIVRSDDVVARSGAGDEFVVVLPKCSPEDARKRAEAIRKKVESVKINLAINPMQTTQYSPTVSIGGYSASQLENVNVESLLNSADQSLYRAKNNGRNRVEFGDAKLEIKPTIEFPQSKTYVTQSVPRKDITITKTVTNNPNTLKEESERKPFEYLAKDYSDEWIESIKKVNHQYVQHTPNNPKVPFAYLAEDYAA